MSPNPNKVKAFPEKGVLSRNHIDVGEFFQLIGVLVRLLDV